MSSITKKYQEWSQGAMFSPDNFWLEEEPDGSMVLKCDGTYTKGSVLEGNYTFRTVDHFQNREMAYAELGAEIDVESRGPSPECRMSDIPPSDFDPADAGEEW